MQKISFDAEDFPPASYYLGNGLDGNDNISSHKANNTLLPAFHNIGDGGSILNIQPADMAPVHQSVKSTGAGKESIRADSLDKSEWWKAPEFVPRNSIQTSSNDTHVIHKQQQQPGTTASVNQHTVNRLSGSVQDLPQIGFQQVAPSPTHQQPHFLLGSKTAPVIHQTLATPMPAPFPIGVPHAGLGPTPAPGFIPLPLPNPTAWPLGATGPGPGASLQFNPALAALQSQLARVYAHNPRVLRGQHPLMPASTAFHNQKLHQLIIRQQQQNQFQQRHGSHQQSIIPFSPSLNPAAAPTGPGIPVGYTANMTTIDAGLGRPIPAIVLKRKRKKKGKKSVDLKEQQKPSVDKESSAVQQESLEDQNRQNQIIDSTADLKSEDISGPRSDDDEDERSSLTSPNLTETRRSEPDLTKMQHDSGQAVCDVLIGTAAEHLVQQSCYYPNDLDLIQSASHCTMITGSCPDLSADIDFYQFDHVNNGDQSNATVKSEIDNRDHPYQTDFNNQAITDQSNSIDFYQSISNQSMSSSNHINPFLQENLEAEDHQEPKKPDHKGQFFIAKMDDASLRRSAYGVDEFDLDTNPVVRDTMRDLASDGMIRSKQVKELNRQVIKDMHLEEKVREWRDEDWSEPELEEDDTIFDRLLKSEDARQHTAKKQLETNPGKGQKSLKEELEEGLMVFRNRGAREYRKVSSSEEEAGKEESRRLLPDDGGIAMVHHAAIVHGSRRHGEWAKTELFNGEEETVSNKHHKPGANIHRATYIESEMEDEERMRITVNALEALDVDGADSFLAKSHLRSVAAGATHIQSMDDVSANTASKRRYSFPESVPLVPLVKSRNCCVLM